MAVSTNHIKEFKAANPSEARFSTEPVIIITSENKHDYRRRNGISLYSPTVMH